MVEEGGGEKNGFWGEVKFKNRLTAALAFVAQLTRAKYTPKKEGTNDSFKFGFPIFCFQFVKYKRKVMELSNLFECRIHNIFPIGNFMKGGTMALRSKMYFRNLWDGITKNACARCLLALYLQWLQKVFALTIAEKKSLAQEVRQKSDISDRRSKG